MQINNLIQSGYQRTQYIGEEPLYYVKSFFEQSDVDKVLKYVEDNQLNSKIEEVASHVFEGEEHLSSFILEIKEDLSHGQLVFQEKYPEEDKYTVTHFIPLSFEEFKNIFEFLNQ